MKGIHKQLMICMLNILLANSAVAHETYHVHPGISNNARMMLARINYEEASSGYFSRDGDCNDIRDGSINEDNIFGTQTNCGVMPFSWVEHGYNPYNGKGWGWGTGTALNKAVTEYQEAVDAYNACNKERAYFQIGRVTHLLEDMTSPGHVHSDMHALGNDFESWAAILEPTNNYRFEPYALGTHIVEPLFPAAPIRDSLGSHFRDLAYKTYYASSFQAILNRSKTTPIDPASELSRMFPGKVSYHPYGFLGFAYWEIAGVGQYDDTFGSDDWWPCEDDPGYFYIENAGGDETGGLYPTEMRVNLIDRDSPMGANTQTIMTRWAEVLFPLTVDYSAGLLKFYYDRMQNVDNRIAPAAPAGVAARAGNGRANVVWQKPQQDACGGTLPDLDGYYVYYSTLMPHDPWAARSSFIPASGSNRDSFELTGLTNKKTYFVAVKAVDTGRNESALSEWVSVKPMGGNTFWVHPADGPTGSYSTISAALANAPTGTTIMVGEGVYHENQLWIGGVPVPGWAPRNITLRSERGPDKTIIDGGNQQIVIHATEQSRVIGFTIRNADGDGIKCSFADGVLIANNIFLSNVTGIYVGGCLENGKPVGIFNNVFYSNHTGIDGYFVSGAILRNNIFNGSTEFAIKLEYSYFLSARYNDFYDNASDLASIKPVMNDFKFNYRTAPGFVNPLVQDFHLQTFSQLRDVAQIFSFTDLVTNKKIWWQECAPGKMWTDLGAYGGPFAYVDNDLDGIPDCELPGGRSSSVAMLVDSVEQPVALQFRDPAETEPAADPSADPAPPGPALTFEIVAPPAHGNLSGTAPDLLYTPDYGYVGEDSFAFTVANEVGESAPAVVTITVKASNTKPVAMEQTVVLTPGDIGYLFLQGSDADGDPLTFAVDSQPLSGSLECPYPPECYFAPATNEPVNFTYHASDGIDDSTPATVNIAFNVAPSISLLTPAAAEAATGAPSFNLRWLDADPDSSASIDLYFDAVGAGYSGTLIVAGIPEDDPTNSFDWYTASLPDGVYYIYAVIRDEWSSARAYAPGPLIVDRTPPAVTIDPPPDPLRQNCVSLSGTMESGAAVTVAVDQPAQAGWVSYPDVALWSAWVCGLASGPVTFTASAADMANNVATAQISTTVNLNQAPVIYSGGDRTVGEGELLSFDVHAYDPDGTTPVIGAAPLPPGATFQGVTFSWQPGFGEAGLYTVTFTADDGDLSVAETVTITVQHTNRAPTVPVLLAPVTRGEVPALQPTLAVENSADADGDALSYEFELYGDAGLTWPLFASGPTPEAAPTTIWTTHWDLPDNTWFWWRARAADRRSFSDWTEAASFFVNLANDPPGDFAVSEPQENAEVTTTTPTLGVSNSADPDGDELRYTFLVYDDAALSLIVASIAGVPAGAAGVTSWLVDPPLCDNTRYFWKAAATDEHGAVTETAAIPFFVNLGNDAPGAPGISSPADGEELPALEASLTVVNAIDPDYDPLWYSFELDTVDTFDGPEKSFSESIPEGIGHTAWPLAGLSDNTLYFWRARAGDGVADSPWTTGAFFTNTANDPPAAVVAQNPGAGAWVDSVTPRLVISAAIDPDRDQVTYAYQIYATPPGAPVAEGLSPETTWIPSQALTDNAWHSWRARAVDEHELEGPWCEPTPFFVNDNGIDDPPSLSLIEPDTMYLTSGSPVAIAWEDGDPDSDAEIALYRASDGAGTGSALIAESIKEDPDGAGDRFLWDPSGVPSGTWRIFGVIRDATSSRVSYAPGSVTIDRQAPVTGIAPPPGTYAGPVNVTMTAVDDRDPNPAIFYTTDGSAPTLESSRYTGPIALAQTTALRYFAVDDAGLQEPAQGPATYVIRPSVTLLTPNGGEVIASGSTWIIRWSAPANATRFDLAYSTNNGGSYTSIATGKSGYSYSWAVPKPTTNSPQCRVRVIGRTASGNTVGTDASDQVFTIEVVRVTAPNGGEVFSRAVSRTRPISWVTNRTSQTVNKVALSYSTDGAGSWTKIAELKTNPGTYTWAMPATNGSRYRVKVDLYRNNTLLGSDTSNANFSVVP